MFGRISDPRAARGNRYSLPGVLSTVFLALVSGANSLRQIAMWPRGQRWKLNERLGFRWGQMPGYNAIRDRLLTLGAVVYPFRWKLGVGQGKPDSAPGQAFNLTRRRQIGAKNTALGWFWGRSAQYTGRLTRFWSFHRIRYTTITEAIDRPAIW